MSYMIALLGHRVFQAWAYNYESNPPWQLKRIRGENSIAAAMERTKSDEELLWHSFLSASVCLTTETLVRTLEGVHSEPPSPFNILAFAMTAQTYQLSSPSASLSYFLHMFIEMAQLLALSIMLTFKERPPVRRLAITTFFGISSALLWLLGSLPYQRPFWGLYYNSAAAEVCMMGVIVVTAALHALTMLLTEGHVDTSRLIFTPSNLPSADDDYQVAILKMATACLQSTRLNGLSRELVAIEVPEKSYVELNEGSQVNLRLGLEGLIRGPDSEGLSNEIRLTLPNEDRSGKRGNPSHENPLLLSTAKWREVKRFGATLAGVTGSLARMLGQRLPSIPWHRLPRWVKELPRQLRQIWHGQNGERRREERIARERLEKERKDKLQEEALRAVLERNGVQLREGEKLQDAAWRAMKATAADPSSASSSAVASGSGTTQARSRAAGATEQDAESMGVDARLWRYLHSTNDVLGGAAGAGQEDKGYDEDEDEEDDDDWTEGDDDSDAESVASGTPASRSRRSRSRSVFSPTPTPDDQQDPDESASLLQLARLDFERPLPGGETQAGDAFSRVLMAHVSSSSQEPPLTRARYRALLPGGVGAGASSGMANLASSPDEDHLRATILRRRFMHNNDGGDGSTAPSPNPASSTAANHASSSSSDRDAERERLRLCVICCYEERTILCWPCRCLALCDGCREELASRPASGGGGGGGGNNRGKGAGLHDCPTCRSKVQGFSRVYLP